MTHDDFSIPEHNTPKLPLPELTKHPQHWYGFGEITSDKKPKPDEPPPPWELGHKDDLGKIRWDLMPWSSIEEMAKVMTYGANKYGDTNWKKLPDADNRYFAAAMRHITSYRLGENTDTESGLPHLMHAAISLVLMHEHSRNNGALPHEADTGKQGQNR
jgi:hypothetical protein